MDKVDSLQEQMGNVSKEMKTEKEPKRNASNQKHCTRNEEYLWWAF